MQHTPLCLLPDKPASLGRSLGIDGSPKNLGCAILLTSGFRSLVSLPEFDPDLRDNLQVPSKNWLYSSSSPSVMVINTTTICNDLSYATALNALRDSDE